MKLYKNLAAVHSTFSPFFYNLSNFNDFIALAEKPGKHFLETEETAAVFSSLIWTPIMWKIAPNTRQIVML